MAVSKIQRLLEAARISSAPIAAGELCRWRARWWSVFATPECPQSWFTSGLYWHCFSYGHTPSLEHQAAESAYRRERHSEAAILSSAAKFGGCRLTGSPPSVEALRALRAELNGPFDLYVVDAGFSWTYVVTHEEPCGLGPYFAKGQWNEAGKFSAAAARRAKSGRRFNHEKGKEPTYAK